MKRSNQVWLRTLLGSMLCFAVGCSNGAAQKQTTNPTTQTGNTGVGNGRAGWLGGGNNGAPGGGMSRPGAGFYVTVNLSAATATSTTTTSSTATATSTATDASASTPTYTAGGFEVTCSKASADQNILVLALHILKSDGIQQYDLNTTFPSACTDATKIVFNSLYTGDTGTLTVTVESLAGKATAEGVAAAFTQAATPMPTPPATDTTGTTGTSTDGSTTTPPQFQRPSPTEVNITMKSVTS